MPPKSQVFRRIERRILGSAMEHLGFARPPGSGVGSWVRSEDRGFLVVWTQLDKWNHGDDPEGYRFTLECQLGSQPITGAGDHRARYYELLDSAQKREHLAIYNGVMAKAKPNPEYMAMLNPDERAEHVEELRPRSEVPARWDDPWLPYVDNGDVEAWMTFLATAMPPVLDRFRAAQSKRPARDRIGAVADGPDEEDLRAIAEVHDRLGMRSGDIPGH